MALFMLARERKEKVYRPLKNPLLTATLQEFYDRYRLDKEAVEQLVNLIRNDIEHPTGKSRAIPALIQTLVTLRYLGGDSLQVDVGDTFGISQSSVSRCVNRVAKALRDRLGEFVYFPDDEQSIQAIQHSFYNKHGFPGVIGLIDCTHIPVMVPNDQERVYVNRKNVHSINVQAIVDNNGRFLNIVAKWPGSTHDAFILRHSDVFTAFENGEICGTILGDSGYPCCPWLMTPFANPATAGQRKYNSAHKKTRVLVEQTYGIWKRRCRCLYRDLRIKLKYVPNIIAACAVIHNIAVDRRLPDLPMLDGENEQPPEHPYMGDGQTGFAYRDALVETVFSR